MKIGNYYNIHLLLRNKPSLQKIEVCRQCFCFLMDLRQPESPPSGVPYSYRKTTATHELIFSWLSWLAVMLAGAYARRRRWPWPRRKYPSICIRRIRRRIRIFFNLLYRLKKQKSATNPITDTFETNDKKKTCRRAINQYCGTDTVGCVWIGEFDFNTLRVDGKF